MMRSPTVAARGLTFPVYDAFCQRFKNRSTAGRRQAVELGQGTGGKFFGPAARIRQRSAIGQIRGQVFTLVIAGALEDLLQARRLFRRRFGQQSN